MSARIEAWMRQAESDFRVGQLTEAQNFHSQACYHYGQTAEKALKGLLISLGIVPPYSHSLDRLWIVLTPGTPARLVMQLKWC